MSINTFLTFILFLFLPFQPPIKKYLISIHLQRVYIHNNIFYLHLMENVEVGLRELFHTRLRGSRLRHME